VFAALDHELLWNEFAHHHVHIGCGTHPSSYPMNFRGCFTGDKPARALPPGPLDIFVIWCLGPETTLSSDLKCLSELKCI
jgi:hypothetical protein